MLQINTILHPTDFSACAEAALAYAIDMARRHDAELHLFHVASQFGENPILGAIDSRVEEEAFYKRLRDAADTQMQAMLDRHDLSGLRTKRVYARGATPGRVITEYAVAENLDLIVLGTHGRRGLRKLFMGSVAEEVTHQATCPVLFVPDPRIADRQASIGRILVPIDFSVYSVNAVAYAKQLAVCYGAALDVYHVIDPILSEQLQQTGWVHRAETEQALKAKALEKLSFLSREIEGPAGIDITSHVAMGNPPVQIAAFAEEQGANLIVIASHGLRGLDTFLVGSVTERVMRLAPCPVFLTRPFGKSLLPHPGKAKQEASA